MTRGWRQPKGEQRAQPHEVGEVYSGLRQDDGKVGAERHQRDGQNEDEGREIGWGGREEAARDQRRERQQGQANAQERR